jgi:hypothetical protein
MKGAQFLGDFALFITDAATLKKLPLFGEGHRGLSQLDAEKWQLAFTEKKYHEKGKGILWPVLRDIIKLNGAWTRAFAEGEETTLSLSYRPDDLFSPEAMDIEQFYTHAKRGSRRVRIFAGPQGPYMEYI